MNANFLLDLLDSLEKSIMKATTDLKHFEFRNVLDDLIDIEKYANAVRIHIVNYK